MREKNGVPNGNLFEPLRASNNCITPDASSLMLLQYLWPHSTEKSGEMSDLAQSAGKLIVSSSTFQRGSECRLFASALLLSG